MLKEKAIELPARSMGISSKMIKVKPSEVSHVTDHPSCWRLSIIHYKNGGSVTVECSPSKTKEKLGL
jgi:hypothetical protein